MLFRFLLNLKHIKIYLQNLDEIRMKLKVLCIIPTYNAVRDLERLLKSLAFQSAEFDTIIIDSSSKDGTKELAQRRIDEVVVIPSESFNHGGTRQQMIDLKNNYDIYVFLTQDAYLAEKNSISNLIEYFSNSDIGAVCGRQLPHKNASLFAKHAREFNYPGFVKLKDRSDIPALGIKTAFMSNSFSAYRREALVDVGGFPNDLIFGEDMYVAAKIILSGWKIAYAGNAICYHSHNYTIKQEFRRYFDMGVFHNRQPWIRKIFNGLNSEGWSYIKAELNYLGVKKIYLWPFSILLNFVKFAGFRLGLLEKKLPLFLKKKMSMSKSYWDK